MTEAMEPDDDDEEWVRGPCMAFPPIYVMRTIDHCPECNEALHVYTMGCTAYHDGEDDEPVEDFYFVRMIESAPSDLLALLTEKCPDFFFDQEEGGSGRRYLMNHCRCGARLDDDYLHGDVGTAFWPDTPDGFAALSLFRLPMDEAIRIVAGYSIGGGEYLDIDNARPW